MRLVLQNLLLSNFLKVNFFIVFLILHEFAFDSHARFIFNALEEHWKRIELFIAGRGRRRRILLFGCCENVHFYILVWLQRILLNWRLIDTEGVPKHTSHLMLYIIGFLIFHWGSNFGHKTFRKILRWIYSILWLLLLYWAI